MHRPVGSLARPESTGDFEAFDASAGVTVYMEHALAKQASEGAITFQFGLLGHCTAVIESSAER